MHSASSIDQKSSKVSAYFILLITVASWGITPTAIRYLVLSINPLDFAVLRLLIIAAALLPALFFIAWPRLNGKEWLALAICAATGITGYHVIGALGYAQTGAGVASLIYSTEPIIIACLASILHRDSMSRAEIVGFCFAASGAIELLWSLSAPTHGWTVAGAALIFGSAFSWSFSTVLIKPILVRHGIVPITTLVSILGSLFGSLFARASALSTLQHLTAMQVAVLLFVGLAAGAGSFGWNYGIQKVPMGIAGGFLYLQPLISVVFAYLFLGEVLGLAQIIGGGFIMTGLALQLTSNSKT